MLTFNNTHLFTGYLKQKLSSVNIPTCKIYTQEFAEYFAEHGTEDPRIIESVDTIAYSDDDKRMAIRVNYLKNNEICNYFWKYDGSKNDLGHSRVEWRTVSSVLYSSEKTIPGLTKTLHSPGRFYDVKTHEYLGEYLRFMRDYHNINLMSLYNCFNDNICNNIAVDFEVGNKKVIFNSKNPTYKIYAFPVKLFADYTIAIDSYQGIEIFCGLYNTELDCSTKSIELFKKTYKKIDNAFFNQPILYDRLNVNYWKLEDELRAAKSDGTESNGQQDAQLLNNTCISRWDIANREQDLKLFIKVPVSCKSSIVALEGDFRTFNNNKYYIAADAESSDSIDTWTYKQNHTIINFAENNQLNAADFTPISKLQLLEFNTKKSYPFADRLIEYLCGSAITPIDAIPDNIKRAQRVMNQNKYYFDIDGLWEPKMQKIIYDYIINSGPICIEDDKLIDKHSGNNPKYYGYHEKLGHTSKSSLYDVLGYVDKDAEKWYASWIKHDNKAIIKDNIQNVDIYNGLYDL